MPGTACQQGGWRGETQTQGMSTTGRGPRAPRTCTPGSASLCLPGQGRQPWRRVVAHRPHPLAVDPVAVGTPPLRSAVAGVVPPPTTPALALDAARRARRMQPVTAGRTALAHGATSSSQRFRLSARAASSDRNVSAIDRICAMRRPLLVLRSGSSR